MTNRNEGATAAGTTYRCRQCGNRTRFDVYESLRRKRFAHYTLGGDVTIDEEEVLSSTIEKVVCRWCDRDDTVDTVVPG